MVSKSQIAPVLTDDDINKFDALNSQPASGGLTDEQMDSATSNVNNKSSYGMTAQQMAVIGPALIGAGYGAHRFLQPFGVRRKAMNDLGSIAQEMQLNKEISPYDIPTLATKRKVSANLEKNIRISELKNKANTTIRGLNQQLSNIDNNILNSTADELAMTIKSNLSPWLKSISDGYDAGMQAVDLFSKEKGFEIPSKQFIESVIDKTINTAVNSGTLSDDLASLQEAKTNLLNKSGLLDKKGNPLSSNMTVSQARGFISSLTKDKPYSKVASILRDNWGSFLEQNAPVEIKPYIENLNNNFKPLAEARNRLLQVVDSRTGEADASKLSKLLASYAKNKADTGLENLAKILGEGTGLSQKVEGVRDKFSQLKNIGKTRSSIIDSIKAIQKNSPEEVGKVLERMNMEIAKAQQWINKSSELTSIAKKADARIENRNVLKWPARLTGMVGNIGRAARAIAPISTIMDAGRLSNDPAAYVYELLGGENVPMKGTADRAKFEEELRKELMRRNQI